MQTAAVGSTGVSGVREACLLAAVLVAASGALPLHASQPPQPPAEADSPQSPDPAGSEQAPSPADEQPDQPDTQQPEGEQPAGADAEQPADAEEAEQPAGTFEAPAGLILSYVKGEGSADYERVMATLGEALAGSEDEERRELLSGWRLYRAREPGPEGEILYVWLIDPAVAGADYAIPQLLGEALPHESQELFDAFSAAFGSGQALINLEPVEIVPASPE